MVIYHLLTHKIYVETKCADVAELADAPDLGSGVPDVQVRFLSSALKEVLKRTSFFCFLSPVLLTCKRNRSNIAIYNMNGKQEILLHLIVQNAKNVGGKYEQENRC